MSKIKISISQLFPDAPGGAFTDIIQLETAHRPRRIGYQIEKLYTDEKFKLVGGTIAERQLIRTNAYDNYRLSIVAHEGQNIENIDISSDVKIYLPDGTIHHAKITQISEPVNLSNTDHRQLDIVYYDINTDNYLGEPTIDTLRSDKIGTEFSTNILGIASTLFKTRLQHNPILSEIKQKSDEINGIETVIKSIVQDKIKIRLYLSEFYSIFVDKNMQTGTPGNIYFYDTENKTTYTAVERIKPDIEQIDFDLFQVDIELKHNSLTINNF